MLQKNSTNKTTEFDYWARLDWILPVSINGVLMLLASWILFSMIRQGVKTGTWKQNPVHLDKLNGSWVYTLAISCAAISVAKYIMTQLSYNLGFGVDQDRTCDVVNKINFINYCLVLFFTFSLIWARQRVFYSNKMLNISYGRTIRFVSAASILLILLAGVLIIVFTVIPPVYRSTPRGCSYYPNVNPRLELYVSVAEALIVLTAQTMLMFLFIYPLQKRLRKTGCSIGKFCFARRHFTATASATRAKITSSPDSENRPSENHLVQETNRSSDLENSRQNQTVHKNFTVVYSSAFSNWMKTSQAKQSAQKIKNVLRRTLIFGSLAIFTDIFLIFINYAPFLNVYDPEHRRISLLFYDINVMLNLLFVLFSFSSWKKIIAWKPFGLRKR